MIPSTVWKGELLVLLLLNTSGSCSIMMNPLFMLRLFSFRTCTTRSSSTTTICNSSTIRTNNNNHNNNHNHQQHQERLPSQIWSWLFGDIQIEQQQRHHFEFVSAWSFKPTATRQKIRISWSTPAVTTATTATKRMFTQPTKQFDSSYCNHHYCSFRPYSQFVQTTMAMTTMATNTLLIIRGGGGGGSDDGPVQGFGFKQHPNNVRSVTSTTTVSATSSSASAGASNINSNSASSLAATEASDERQKVLELAIESLCNPQGQKDTIRTFGGLLYTNTKTNTKNNADSTTNHRVLFVLGGPGAGKGTQSELMLQHYPVVHYSIGQLLRTEETKIDSQYRTIIQETLSSGTIVPVEISLQLLQNEMKHNQKQKDILVLIDGFPRNYDNLYGWCTIMSNTTSLQSVLVYQCPLNVLEKRILHRAQQTMLSLSSSPSSDNNNHNNNNKNVPPAPRSDDNLIALQKRFRTFEQQTIPVIDILREAVSVAKTRNMEKQTIQDNNSTGGTNTMTPMYYSVVDIQGDRSIEDVWGSTKEVLNKLIIDDVLTANAALLDAIESNDSVQYQQLCDPSWFSASSDSSSSNVYDIFAVQEGILQQQRQQHSNDGGTTTTTSTSSSNSNIYNSSNSSNNKIHIENASVDIISGKHVAVSYNRWINGMYMKEKRFWSHHGINGWQLVHFVRTPSTEHGNTI